MQNPGAETLLQCCFYDFRVGAEKRRVRGRARLATDASIAPIAMNSSAVV